MSKSRKKQPTGDYPVGYCRPPVHRQWRPGQSGNPAGPARSECINLLEGVSRALKRRTSLPFGGKTVSMSLMEVFTHQLVIDATKGTPSARRELLKLLPFSETLKAHSEDEVWEVELVFDDEEDRYSKIARENEQHKAEIDRLRALVRVLNGHDA